MYTLEILQIQFQTMAVKWVLQCNESINFFLVHIKVMITPYCSLLSVQ